MQNRIVPLLSAALLAILGAGCGLVPGLYPRVSVAMLEQDPDEAKRDLKRVAQGFPYCALTPIPWHVKQRELVREAQRRLWGPEEFARQVERWRRFYVENGPLFEGRVAAWEIEGAQLRNWEFVLVDANNRVFRGKQGVDGLDLPPFTLQRPWTQEFHLGFPGGIQARMAPTFSVRCVPSKGQESTLTWEVDPAAGAAFHPPAAPSGR